MMKNKADLIENNLVHFYLSLQHQKNISVDKKDGLIYIKNTKYSWPNLLIAPSSPFEKIVDYIHQYKSVNPRQFWLTNDQFIKKNQEKIRDQNFIPITIWESMYLEKKERLTPVNLELFDIIPVQSKKDFDDWIQIVHQTSFLPDKMDVPLFEYMYSQSNFRFYVGKYNDQPVATAMTYNDGNTTGLYYVNVKKAFRKKGFGTSITIHCINNALEQFGADIVLHSSKMAKSLYSSLGFEENGQLVIFAVS